MGQAKQRKAEDPFYGRVPKNGKGIVISPPIIIHENGDAFLRSSKIDPTELRRSALFWDRIAHPDNSLISIGEDDADVELLIKEGLMFRPSEVVTSSGNGFILFAEAHVNAFLKLDQADPGAWSLAEGPSSFMMKRPEFNREAGFRVELTRAIPMPSGDVPLEKLLKFKKDRRDQWLGLMVEIDELMINIMKSETPNDEMRLACRNIEMKCIELSKVFGESGLKFEWRDCAIDFSGGTDFGEMIKNAAICALFGRPFGFPKIGAAIGALTPMMKFTVAGGLKISSRRRASSPYNFVAELQTLKSSDG